MAAHALRRPRLGSLLAPGRPAELAAGLLVAGLAGALTWFLNDVGLFLGLVAVVVFGLAVWLAATRHTLVALALFMIYIGVLDGYLKLATGSSLVTLLRDVLLFSIVVGLLVRAQVQGRRLTAPPLTGWIAAFAVIVLVQVFNPAGGTLAHSLAGVRQHLEFVPLFFLTFAFVRTTRALRIFVVLILLIAAANGVASWVQFNLTPDQMATWGPGYAERVLAKGRFANSARTFSDTDGKSRTRPFGLGSEAGSGGIIGIFALGGIIALASRFGRLRYLLFAVAMAIGALTAIVTSQGRGVVVGGVVVVFSYALLVLSSGGRARGLAGLGIAAIVCLLVVQTLVGSVGTSRLRYEGLSASQIVATTGQARPGNVTAIASAISNHPFGAGLAVAGPASGSPGGTELTQSVDAESELSFLTLETGVAGMVLIVAFTVLLFVLGVRRLRHEPDREARVLLAAIIAPIGGLIALYYPSPPTATTPSGPYLWAVAGIVAYWLVARPAQRRRESRWGTAR